MKFRFKNLGPIKEADLELGDLTIIAGRNNTGKNLPCVRPLRIPEEVAVVAGGRIVSGRTGVDFGS